VAACADQVAQVVRPAPRDGDHVVGRMREAYKKRGRDYPISYLRDRVHDATEAGLLPKRGRGVVTTEGTEKLRTLVSGRKGHR
jgi:hypothetical protein